MSTSRYFDRICAAAVALALVLTLVFMNGEALGIQASDATMGYETRLFDTEKAHTIDIVMDDWDSFIEGCEDEEYEACSVVIDGEAYKNVALRAKGNTSLSSVSAMGSSRYSFKIEFDHYDSGKSYYGLDKLSLNNLIQDTTYMKDYLTYRLMAQFGVDAPLCSYVYITVNGEDWGLYLAVEGVEDGFLQRNYGTDYGELYKPDSLSFGGGRGNGEEFSMEDFDAAPTDSPFSFGGGGGMSFGMGSSDVKLQYIDDDPDSYSNIFDNAKTDITEADEERLISSLKQLSANENIESVVDVDEVIRYFVVHNFVCNDDSYTGMMVHNYYLYEEDGQLSMIPWDYNLAFGTFSANDATGTVNTPIDTPASGSTEDLPMLNWIFESEEYTETYHQYFAEFLKSADFSGLIGTTAELIAPYVEKDATAFYTYEEFEAGVETLKTFCELRCESIEGQLDGTIPSTTAGQMADSSALVDASSITLSDMGSMNDTGNGGGSMPSPGGDFGDFDGDFSAAGGTAPANAPNTDTGSFPNAPGGDFPGSAGASAETESEGGDSAQSEDKSAPASADTGASSGAPAAAVNLSATENTQNTESTENSENTGSTEGEESAESTADAQGDSFGGSSGMPAGTSGGETPSGQPESFDGTMPQNADFSAGSGSSQSGTGMQELILLGISAAVMALGLLVAFLFKGRR